MKAILAKYILDVNGVREDMAVLIEGNKIYDVIPKDNMMLMKLLVERSIS